MYVIHDSCIACGACEAQCPTNTITMGDGLYVVGQDCIDCGACANVCPVDAPKPE
ncbi:MAG: 4Fe-4S binding protein [Bacillota bacterium]|nr:4Fe-4S binding protein [Bacillota bacterium]